MLTSMVLIIRGDIRYNYFIDKFTRVFRIIQEVSFTIILILICVFYYDSVHQAINQDIKLILVILFSVLVIKNILLEIINAVILTIAYLKEKCGSKKKKVSKENKIFDSGKDSKAAKMVLKGRVDNNGEESYSKKINKVKRKKMMPFRKLNKMNKPFIRKKLEFESKLSRKKSSYINSNSDETKNKLNEDLFDEIRERDHGKNNKRTKLRNFVDGSKMKKNNII